MSRRFYLPTINVAPTPVQGEPGAAAVLSATIESLPPESSPEVTMEPTGEPGQYIARFKVPRGEPGKPLHPLAGSLRTIYDDGVTHPWAAGQWEGANGVVFIAIRGGWRHEPSKGDTVKVFRSYDGGVRLEEPSTAYSNSDRSVLEVCGGRMGQGRSFLLLTTTDGVSTFLEKVFSDDECVTWTAPTPVAASPSVFLYGSMVKIPGVANDAGWCFFGHGGTERIYALQTLDNGVTLTQHDCFGATLPFTAREASVELLPIAGVPTWAMAIRDNAGGVLRMSVSTSLTSWPMPVATSLPVGANPPMLLADADLLYIYAFARQGSAINGIADALVYWIADPNIVANASGNPGALTMRVAFRGAKHMIGYARKRLGPEGWTIIFTEGESSTGSGNASTSMVSQAGALPYVAASPAILGPRAQPNLWDNGSLQNWTRGASFALSDGLAFADRFLFDGASTGVVTQAEVPYWIARGMTHDPLWMAQFSGSAAANCGIRTVEYGVRAVRLAADRVYTISGYVFGAVGDPMFAEVRIDTNGVAGVLAPGPLQIRARPAPYGVSYFAVTLRTPSIEGLTLGALPKVEWRLYSPLSAPVVGAWCGVKLEPGQVATPIEPGARDARAHLDRFVERKVIGPSRPVLQLEPYDPASGIAWGVLPYGEKDAASPSIVATYLDCEIARPLPDTARPVTGVSFTGVSRDRAEMRVTATGYTAADRGGLRTKATGYADFLIDCGF